MKKIMTSGLAAVLAFGLLTPFASAAVKNTLYSSDTVMRNMNTGNPATTKSAGICPVLGGKASPSVSYQYKGKTYYFCCATCINEFKKNPEKYLRRIKELNVVAKKYAFVPAEIRVKQNDIVKITLTSEDVAHGLAIKEYGINVSVNKGETKKIEFLADKKGTFVFRCSVFCGFGHSGMTGKLIVE
jgi:heme/copper-type cytochrome/quinol oxidase subunit 2